MERLTGEDAARLGDFELLARLTSGGMGQLYLAVASGGGFAAVKVLHAAYGSDPQFRIRFSREVQTLTRLHSRWAVPVLGADPDAERPWLATEYLPAPTLDEVVASAGGVRDAALNVLAAGLTAALADLHAQDVLHRDLKPSNVLVTLDGPRLIDFGISRGIDADRITRTGTVIGTPAYTSPEQALGEGESLASDVFAMASVLVYAATGSGPFGRTDNAVAMLRRIVDDEPSLDGVPEPLREPLAACLAKDPAARPTAAELAARVAALAAEAPPTAWPTISVRALVERRQRELRAAALAAMDRTATLSPTPVPPRAAASPHHALSPQHSAAPNAASAASAAVSGPHHALTPPPGGPQPAASGPHPSVAPPSYPGPAQPAPGVPTPPPYPAPPHLAGPAFTPPPGWTPPGDAWTYGMRTPGGYPVPVLPERDRPRTGLVLGIAGAALVVLASVVSGLVILLGDRHDTRARAAAPPSAAPVTPAPGQTPNSPDDPDDPDVPPNGPPPAPADGLVPVGWLAAVSTLRNATYAVPPQWQVEPPTVIRGFGAPGPNRVAMSGVAELNPVTCTDAGGTGYRALSGFTGSPDADPAAAATVMARVWALRGYTDATARPPGLQIGPPRPVSAGGLLGSEVLVSVQKPSPQCGSAQAQVRAVALPDNKGKTVVWLLLDDIDAPDAHVPTTDIARMIATLRPAGHADLCRDPTRIDGTWC